MAAAIGGSSHLRLRLSGTSCVYALWASFPVGHGSNGVQATSISSTVDYQCRRLVVYRVAFPCRFVFRDACLGWNALRHYGQIILLRELFSYSVFL